MVARAPGQPHAGTPGIPTPAKREGRGTGGGASLGTNERATLALIALTKPPRCDVRASLQWEFRHFPPLSCRSPSQSNFLALLWW